MVAVVTRHGEVPPALLLFLVNIVFGRTWHDDIIIPWRVATQGPPNSKNEAVSNFCRLKNTKNSAKKIAQNNLHQFLTEHVSVLYSHKQPLFKLPSRKNSILCEHKRLQVLFLFFGFWEESEHRLSSASQEHHIL